MTRQPPVIELSFFIFQNVIKLGWPGLHDALVEWRSTTKTAGERCAMITGALSMLTWCVESWAVGQFLRPKKVASLERGSMRFGWMMCSVLVMRLPSSNAHTNHSAKITVATVKMLGLSVQVSLFIYIRNVCFTWPTFTWNTCNFIIGIVLRK